ncbi:MAG: phosphatase PAP2 family protein [Gemmatimonadota bacterium]
MTFSRGASVGLFLAIATLLLFLGVTALVDAELTRRMDAAVLGWFESMATPRLDGAALEMTALGSAYVATIVAVVASIFLWEHRHRYSAILVWIALTGGWVLNRLLKTVFDRARPEFFEWRTPYAGGASYPSGHSTTAMVIYATLAYVVFRLEPTPTLRRVTTAVFAVVIALVGASRIYLGVHYPSDVLAGYLIGLSWAAVCVLGVETVRRRRSRGPAQREVGGVSARSHGEHR